MPRKKQAPKGRVPGFVARPPEHLLKDPALFTAEDKADFDLFVQELCEALRESFISSGGQIEEATD